MVLNVFLLILGFAALVKGADLFVDGSSAVARKLRVPGMVIGLTIVAMGTSAPELAVSASGAAQGANELALSNVIGSNIFNLLCVLGFCAVFHSVPIDRITVRRDFSVSIVMTVFVLAVAAIPALAAGRALTGSMDVTVGVIGRGAAAVLLLAFLAYMVFLVRGAMKNASEEETYSDLSAIRCVLYILIGLALIIGGGQAVVYSAKEIARAAGMSETLIGLTIVAVGTSLPELVTSIVAAAKKETDMAVGNAIGSNLFNLMFILGVSAMIHPVSVNLASIWDLVILLAITLLTALFALTGKKINRFEGIAMILVYVADVVFAVVR